MIPENIKQKTLKKIFIKYILPLSVFIFVLFLLPSCNTTEPPPQKSEKPKLIELNEITKSCTEAFIKVTVKDTILPANVTITRDGKEIMNYYQTKTDTTLIDTGLAAAKTYLYKAIIGNNKEEGKSKGLTVSTLPTTSSNFTWETYTFGKFEYGSSNLRDVAIIDENDIWAVGEIHLKDSTGENVTYNAVHWNGNEWELKRIMFYTICGQSHETSYPTSAIFVFNENEIWIALDGSQIAIIKDNKQISVMCLPFSFSIRKLWGSSSDDVYAVGDNGSIAHYNGTSWSKIESGTTTDINDIWGYYDKERESTTVIAVASELMSKGEYRLFSINKTVAKDTLNYPYEQRLRGIWFKNKYSPIYVCGYGIKENKRGNWKENIITNWAIKSIRGNDVNDIVAVDAEGVVHHYNGLLWQKDEQLKLKGYSFKSITIKNNIVVTVGSIVTNHIVGSAVIAFGKR